MAAAALPHVPTTSPLPFLGDDIFVLIATELDACMLGRLGCAAQRFARPSIPDPCRHITTPLHRSGASGWTSAKSKYAFQAAQQIGCRPMTTKV
jgi:hypothetical protein